MTRIIKPFEISPTIQISNYHSVNPGAYWGPRKINDIELVYVKSGNFTYESDNHETVSVNAGEVLCILPDISHTLKHISSSGTIGCIHCELLPDMAWATGDYRLDPEPKTLTSINDNGRIHALFQETADVFEGYAVYREALLQTIVREIWIRLSAYWNTTSMTAISPRIQEMIAYLRANLHNDISRQNLADVFGLTPQHVNALFRKELGISPTQLIQRERILQACRLLRNDNKELTAIASQVGFNDQFYFSRIFKKITGMPPSRFR